MQYSLTLFELHNKNLCPGEDEENTKKSSHGSICLISEATVQANTVHQFTNDTSGSGRGGDGDGDEGGDSGDGGGDEM